MVHVHYSTSKRLDQTMLWSTNMNFKEIPIPKVIDGLESYETIVQASDNLVHLKLAML